jgi:hypothetical protein
VTRGDCAGCHRGIGGQCQGTLLFPQAQAGNDLDTLIETIVASGASQDWGVAGKPADIIGWPDPSGAPGDWRPRGHRDSILALRFGGPTPLAVVPTDPPHAPAAELFSRIRASKKQHSRGG